jgi:hypothetical protein
MTEHPTKSELDNYCRRVLAPANFLSVHRHVITCAHCAAQCNAPRQLSRDLAHLQEALVTEPDGTPYHLSEPEIVAYARGGLDEVDREIAESHLGICSTCSSEVHRHAEVERIGAAHSKPSEFSSRQRFVTWRWRVAAAVLGVAVLTLLTIWLLRTRPAEHKDQAALPASAGSTPSPGAQVQSFGTPEDSPAEAVRPKDGLPNTQFAIVLNDGASQVTMDNQGTLAGLEQLSPRIQQKIKVALQAGKLEQPAALGQVNSKPSTLLSESGDGLPFLLLNPLAQVVRSQQPTFRWRSLPGAQSYKVIVTDADLNEVAISPLLNTTEWRITQPLKPGGIYSWQVTALKNGVAVTSPALPAPQAKFKILDHSTLETLQQAERAYPRSHITRGVLYSEAGLLEDAERELRLLVRENPNADIARRLLRSIRSMRTARSF